ncbi:MAG: hypothetical protein H6756_12280 [Candidatus Omnitrophica bacterium]|nr:hypothetical protein [Candidatus Omnitrophota bacterium]
MFLKSVSRVVLLLLIVTGATFTQSGDAEAADKTAVWVGGSGTWSNPLKWNIDGLGSTGEVPCNGGNTFDVVISGGTVNFDVPNCQIDSLQWTGGTLTGSGPIEVLIGIEINSGTTKQLNSKITNSGVANWLNDNVQTGSGGLFTNTSQGTFNALADGKNWFASGGFGAFANEGVLNVNVSTSAGIFTTFSSIPGSSQINVQSGLLSIGSGGGDLNGQFTGPGAFQISSGTFKLGDGGLSSVSDFRITGGTVTLTGGVFTIQNKFSWTGGNIQGPGEISVTNTGEIEINSGGTKQLNAKITNSGVANWLNDNVQTGSGGLFTNTSQGTFNALADGKNWFASGGFGAFANEGILHVNVSTSAGIFTTFSSIPGSSQINVQSGLLSIGSGGGDLSGQFTGPGAFQISSGTFKLGDGGLSSVSDFRITGGTVTLTGGVFTIENKFSWTGGTIQGTGEINVTHTGEIEINAGSTKHLNAKITNAGVANWLDDDWFAGAPGIFTNTAQGTFNALANSHNLIASGGIGTFQNEGIFNADVSNSAGVFTNFNSIPATSQINVLSGNLVFGSGSGDLNGQITGPGSFQIISGSFKLGDGGVSSVSDFRITGGTVTLTGGVFTIQNKFSWTGGNIQGPGEISVTNTGEIEINSGGTKQLNAKITNSGVANWLNDNVQTGSGGLFTNTSQGTFNALADGKNWFASGGFGAFANEGILHVNVSTSAGIFTTFSSIPGSSQINVQSGLLSIGSGGGDLSGQFTGPGAFQISSGTFKLGDGGLSSVSDFRITGGTVTLTGGVFTIENKFSWTGGTIQGTGEINVTHTGEIEINAGSTKHLNAKITNAGVANWLDDNWFAGSLGIFTNTSQGTFNAFADSHNLSASGGIGTFRNEGKFKLEAPSGIGISTNFNQEGTLTGTGVLTVSSSNGTLRNAGRISAGSSPGMLTINSNVVFEEGSDLFLEFQGTGSGTQFDEVVVNGNVTFDGNLLGYILSNPSQINASDLYFSVSANSVSGNFDNIQNGDTLSTLDGGGQFDVYYGPSSGFEPNKLVLTNFANQGGTLPADLSLLSSYIVFNPLNPGVAAPITITASVLNKGYQNANNVTLSFQVYEPGSGFVEIGTAAIASIAPSQFGMASIQTSFPAADFRLIRVIVDPQNAILEMREDNNQASQVLTVGEPDFGSASLLVFGNSASTCQGRGTYLTGEAFYDFESLPNSNKDFPVEGGRVTIRLVDPGSQQIVATYLGLTGTNGSYKIPVTAPQNDIVYDLLVEVTDFTLVGESPIPPAPGVLSYSINGMCPVTTPPPPPDPCTDCPPPPPIPPVPSDVLVTSQGITFSFTNPDLGQEINISALINLTGSTPYSGIPVTINDLYPVAGDLRTFSIAEAIVDFPNASAGSPVQVTTPWMNTAEGAHIIQVVAQPGFPQPVSNDKATRIIFVGDAIEATLDKSHVLEIDADGNGLVTPGDTLKYTLRYENNSQIDLTGAELIDDYDESLLSIVPVSLTASGGMLDNGTIKWSLGTIPYQAIGVITYQGIVQPVGEDTIITNAAFLSSNEAPTIGDVEHVLLTGNRPPTCDAGPNLTIYSEEVNLLVLSGTILDPDGDDLTYQWFKGSTLLDEGPVDGNGNAPLVLANLSSPPGIGQHTLILNGSDGSETCTDSMILTVDNSPPMVAPNGGGTFQLGQDITLRGDVSDFDGDDLNYRWYEGSVEFANDFILSIAGGQPVMLPEVLLPGGLPLGIHEVFLSAHDGTVAAVPHSIILEVVDTEDPTLNPEATPLILWPPNHKMVDVTIVANASDNSGVVTLSVEVFSSEQPDTDGDGNTIPDFTEPVIDQETGIITLQLRAERKGSGDGRVYTIEITATDNEGNSTVAIVEIIAPHDRGDF